jgi:signal recognition particle receptor subunit alpha
MIDHFAILSRGGAVLWSRTLSTDFDGQAPVNSLIQKVLLEEKNADNFYRFEDYTLKWSFCNELDLVLVAVYLTMAQLLYLDDFLAAVKKEFSTMFKGELTVLSRRQDFTKFDSRFDKTLAKYEAQSYNKSKTPRSFEQTVRGRDILQQGGLLGDVSGEKKPKKPVSPRGDGKDTNDTKDGNSEDDFPMEDVKKPGKPRAFEKKIKNKPGKPAGNKPTKPVWNGRGVTAEDINNLDFSDDKPGLGQETSTGGDEFGEVPKVGESGYMDDSESSESEEEQVKPTKGGMFSFLKKITGYKVLTRDDLAPALKTFREALMGKNVAAEIADNIVESVAVSLENKNLGALTTIHQTVKRSIEESLTRVMTPKKTIDVLQGIMTAKEQKRPYKIVFCGVNGVGKSTNLAKVAAYFISKGLKVSIAACDTFRSGAIEQLQTHCTKLGGVPLYSRGYDKDAAAVCREAVAQATKNKDDVLLIDTAGRMQHNDPLMRALVKLITVNNPDLILFVGEALVGNDAVDQLTQFNRCLKDLSDNPRNPRLIDGIVLTKFDTIDDNVGAAISMTYCTGQPIMFVGTGQTYTDLKRMNVKMLIKALLK